MKNIKEALQKIKEIEFSENKKYEYFLINSFIAKNFKEVSKEEFLEIKKNQIICNFLIKKNENNLHEEILNKCLAYEMSFPHKFKQGFLKKMHFSKIEKYFSILEKEEKVDQLSKYFVEYEKYFEFYFSKKNNVSNIIGELVLEKKPETFLNYVDSWNSEKMCNWLDKNKKHIKPIVKTMFFTSSKYINTDIANKIYSILLENKKELYADKNYLSQLFLNLPISYYDYLIKNEKECLEDFLKERFSKSNYYLGSILKDEDVYTLNLNGLQLILSDNKLSDLTFSNLLKEYNHLIFEPIIIDSKFYEKEENFLEFCLSKQKYDPFPLLNINEVGEKEQKILTATSFHIVSNFDNPEKKNSVNSKLLDWASQTLVDAPNEYFDKCMKKLEDYSSSIKSIQLYRELNSKLECKEDKNKKLKL